jgi:hypothetical protein
MSAKSLGMIPKLHKLHKVRAGFYELHISYTDRKTGRRIDPERGWSIIKGDNGLWSWHDQEGYYHQAKSLTEAIFLIGAFVG